MPINFPKMHIATSVVNRILNAAEGVAATPGIKPNLPVDIPSPAGLGETLDSALAAPVPELPPLDAAPSPGKTVAGAPLLSTFLEPQA